MKGTVTLGETYAGSIEQTGFRMFWAATAINNFITRGADASNTFADVFVDKKIVLCQFLLPWVT